MKTHVEILVVEQRTYRVRSTFMEQRTTAIHPTNAGKLARARRTTHNLANKITQPIGVEKEEHIVRPSLPFTLPQSRNINPAL